MSRFISLARPSGLRQKLMQLHWGVIGLIIIIGFVGIASLYSVADGHFSPWASRHLVRLIIGLAFMLAIAVVDIRHWLLLAYVIFAAGLLLLLGVEFFGTRHMGAQRWIDFFGIIEIQPSEMMRLGLILSLARYYHHLPTDRVSYPTWLLLPALLIIVPAILIIRQPDLGTAILFVLLGVGILFFAGLNWRYFAFGAISLIPIGLFIWANMRSYQKERVLTFLDPGRDPLGAGYHILQSKIAIGSGGLSGKGFMNGTQTHLNFLPEKHTDFIFTMIAEEFGLMGCLLLLALYIGILASGYRIAATTRSHFGRMLASGVCLSLFLYLFVNVAMVIGILPVVGVPMPLISYGGTSLLTLLVSIGLLLNVHLYRNIELPQN